MPFILITFIGVTLIFLNFKAIKKEKNSFTTILKDEEENMEEYKILLGETKREFTETIFELQKELEELKEKFSELSKNSEKEKNVKKVEIYDKKETSIKKVEIYDKIEHNEKIEGNKKNSKINEIENLFKQGLDVDTIAKQLNIGKGEVLLIKELYLK